MYLEREKGGGRERERKRFTSFSSSFQWRKRSCLVAGSRILYQSLKRSFAQVTERMKCEEPEPQLHAYCQDASLGSGLVYPEVSAPPGEQGAGGLAEGSRAIGSIRLGCEFYLSKLTLG